MEGRKGDQRVPGAHYKAVVQAGKGAAALVILRGFFDERGPVLVRELIATSVTAPVA